MRDYRQEVMQWIDKSIPDGDYTASDVAHSIICELEVTDPDLLEGWTRSVSTRALIQQISSLRINRARLAHRSKSAFQEAVEESENGNTEALRVFSQSLVVDFNNTARRIGELTSLDCRFIANKHSLKAKHHLFEAAVFNALANSLPDGLTIADVYTEEEYLNFRSLINV